MKVPINKPKSVQLFQNAATELEKDLSVARDLLFDKIEETARKDEEFVSQQQTNINDIKKNLNVL
jgi:hypothetical protein